MLLPTEQVKQAILHPDLHVRGLAVEYFAKSFSDDTSVMPIVIEAVERFGRAGCTYLLRDAEKLRQTKDTLRWCLEELARDTDLNEEEQSEFDFALSRILAGTGAAELLTNEADFSELPRFLEDLRLVLINRIQLNSESIGTLWERLSDFCEQERDAQYLSDMDLPYAYRVIDALARGGADVEERDLELLSDNTVDNSNGSRGLLHGFVLRLAGEMRLRAAVPFLIKTLKLDDECFKEGCECALIRIGCDDVVDRLTANYRESNWHLRLSSAAVLEHIHTELAARKCLEFFATEPDPILKPWLAVGAVSHFSSESIEPVRQFILESELDAEILELRDTLVAASMVMDADFPERDAWRTDESERRELRKLFAQQNIAKLEAAPTNPRFSESDFDGPDADILAESAHAPTTFVREDFKVGRNEPCPCGSGKKYKKCCMKGPGFDPRLN